MRELTLRGSLDSGRCASPTAASPAPWPLPNTKSEMPYIYPEANKLDQEPKVGTGDCVPLVQHYAGAPGSAQWREGERVRGSRTIKPGTAIATFENGRYANRSSGNHAAFYIGQDSLGIYVVDQWKGERKPRISRRHIRFRGANADGSYPAASDNGDAFSVIE